MLAPGTYPALNLSGKVFGGATIQCAKPGACILKNSDLVRVRDLTVDGVLVRSGNVGINIDESQNITIRCSTFVEQTNSGILVNPGRSNERIVLDKNVFHNSRTGCNYVTGDCSGHLSDGSPVANMDYGIRAYDAN